MELHPSLPSDTKDRLVDTGNSFGYFDMQPFRVAVILYFLLIDRYLTCMRTRVEDSRQPKDCADSLGLAGEELILKPDQVEETEPVQDIVSTWRDDYMQLGSRTR